MKPGALFALALLAGFRIPLAAQSAPGSPTNVPNVGTSTRTPGQAVPSTPTTSSKGNGDFSRPIYISGKVVIADGSPVPLAVAIQRICSGTSRTVAYTDEKGRFNFQWGQTSGVVADASDSGFGIRNSSPTGGFGGAQSAGGASSLASDPYANMLSNCELRASLGGYLSDSVNLFVRSAMDNSDVGMIVLRRVAGVEGTSVSASSLLAPKDAKKSYEHGLQSMLKNKPDDAAKDFEKAVKTYPNYADAWMKLGLVRLQQKDAPRATEALQKAIDADPKLVTPYLELGALSAQRQNWADTNRYLDRALKLDPVDYPQAWYTNAVAAFNLNQLDAAEKSVRQAVRLDPHHANPREQYLLGLVLKEKRDYAGAAQELTAYVQFAPTAADLPEVREEIRKIEKLLGDALQSAK